MMKDPFEAAYEEESPPESPTLVEDEAAPPTSTAVDGNEEDADVRPPRAPSGAEAMLVPPSSAAAGGKGKEEEEEEEEDENMEVELGKYSGDPHKTAEMQAILSQFTEEQMSRYESFRRSGFQKSNMKRLLVSITGSQKISMPMMIVVSGIAKMFVGELIETGRIVMTERRESGPLRPCHIREAFRRLKMEGKVPRR
ncbi:hypothetical protein QJS10_CPA01g01927 [Acorus calamus]|uniref:TAFII28-like protein domain-containing protein n=1 Tax=Acorus calamus TaxID=4465 RepID=A0AAV9FJV2_ACOCL|nr:hypothetical protein QJS10_CPA01g01927 [Acorus calamus]